MLKLGEQQFEITSGDECSHCRSGEAIQGRFKARLWLQRFKNDRLSMNALRRMLAREQGLAWNMDQASDDQIIDRAAEYLGFGAWQVHELPGLHDRSHVQDSSSGSGSAGGDDSAAAASSSAAAKATGTPQQAERLLRMNEPPAVRTRHWVEFRVVNDKTEDPVPNVQITIQLPDGSKQQRTTSASGEVRFDDTLPGECMLSCDPKDARLADVVHFVKTTPPSTSYWADSAKSPPAKPPHPLRIAVISEHKVRTGETLAGIAKANGMSWQSLAKFNWGTASPSEINNHLREQVGCTKKTRDGRNYVFDSSDEPGILYIPKPWKQGGLSTDESHTVRVKTIRNLIIRLEDDLGHGVPETSYEMTFESGDRRTGKLGRSGLALIADPPVGSFALVYPDHDDILAKSIAARVRQAFDDGETGEVFGLLENPPDTIRRAIAAYDRYWNDYTGQGLVEDIYQEVTEDGALNAVEGLLAYAGLPTRGSVKVVQTIDLEQQDKRQD